MPRVVVVPASTGLGDSATVDYRGTPVYRRHARRTRRGSGDGSDQEAAQWVSIREGW
jgi:hypothetical protein